MLDRKTLNQPYTMGKYIRASHTPFGLYLPEDADYHLEKFMSVGNKKRWISGSDRIKAAQAMITRHDFLGCRFADVLGPLRRSGQEALGNPDHQTALALLTKNEGKISDGLDLLHWFKSPGVYLAGGALVSAALSTDVKDLDFFFSDKKTRLEFQKFVMAEGYSPVAVTQNAITFSKDKHIPIQLVFNHYFDFPEFCILAFDWSPAQFAIFCDDGKNGMHSSLLGLSYTCTSRWGENIVNKSMGFNPDSLGSRRASFFRALKYREKYGFTIWPYQFDHPSITPSSLLLPTEEPYGIPKPWEDLWTAPDMSKKEDVLGSIEDLGGSEYDNTMYLQLKINSLIDSHRSSWSAASSRRICHEITEAIEQSPKSGFLAIDNSIIEECFREDNFGSGRWSYYVPAGIYAKIVRYCIDAPPDKSFSILLKMAMSMEIACETEYESLKEGQCLSLTPIEL